MFASERKSSVQEITVARDQFRSFISNQPAALAEFIPKRTKGRTTMGFFQKFMDIVKMNDDSDFDDYDDYEEYLAAEEEKKRKKQEKKEQRSRERQAKYDDEDEESVYEAPAKSASTTKRTIGGGSTFSERNSGARESYSSVAARSNANRFNGGSSMNSTAAAAQPVNAAQKPAKVVSMNRTSIASGNRSSMEVSISKPSNIEDAQDISDMLMSGKPIIVNLEGLDIAMAQRIMDFVSGCVYTLDGKLLQISGYIFILSPKDVDVSGDYLALLKQDAFGVPTFSRN